MGTGKSGVIGAVCAVLLSTASPAASESADRVVPDEPDLMCGPNCLWQVAYMYGRTCTLSEVRRFVGTRPETGTSVEGIVQASAQMGLSATAARCDLSTIRSHPGPVILYFDAVKPARTGHFVVLSQVGPDHVRVLDGKATREFPLDNLGQSWLGGMATLA